MADKKKAEESRKGFVALKQMRENLNAAKQGRTPKKVK